LIYYSPTDQNTNQFHPTNRPLNRYISREKTFFA
jgi:hypothetical protein